LNNKIRYLLLKQRISILFACLNTNGFFLINEKYII